MDFTQPTPIGTWAFIYKGSDTSPIGIVMDVNAYGMIAYKNLMIGNLVTNQAIIAMNLKGVKLNRFDLAEHFTPAMALGGIVAPLSYQGSQGNPL
jgi:hypothetical protein